MQFQTIKPSYKSIFHKTMLKTMKTTLALYNKLSCRMENVNFSIKKILLFSGGLVDN